MQPFRSAEVERVFSNYPPAVRREMLKLRALIFETAAATAGVDKVDETLKWGEPAYVTSKSRSGSTVRIDWKKALPVQYAMYFNCQTNLVETFRTLFPHEFHFDGNRALIFKLGEPIPTDALCCCISASLTYHLRKVRRRGTTENAA